MSEKCNVVEKDSVSQITSAYFDYLDKGGKPGLEGFLEEDSDANDLFEKLSRHEKGTVRRNCAREKEMAVRRDRRRSENGKGL